MFKRKKRSLSAPARIVSADGNKVVVEVEIDKAKYRRGQVVVATVSTKEKTTEGKPVIVSDVVAQGTIAEVNGKRVTICSSRNNPIVSRRAATEAKKHDTKVNVRVVQSILLFGAPEINLRFLLLLGGTDRK